MTWSAFNDLHKIWVSDLCLNMKIDITHRANSLIWVRNLDYLLQTTERADGTYILDSKIPGSDIPPNSKLTTIYRMSHKSSEEGGYNSLINAFALPKRWHLNLFFGYRISQEEEIAANYPISMSSLKTLVSA